MAFKLGLKHGLYVQLFDKFSVGINEDAEYWNLPEEKQKEVMAAAREKLKYAHDYNALECFIGCGFDENDTRAVEEIRIALGRAEENPFIGESLVSACVKYLQKIDSRTKMKKLHRAANNGLRKLVYERDAGRCRYCGEAVPFKAPLDHIIPYSIGGKTEFENLVVSCRPCNSEKSGRTPEQAGMKLRAIPKKKSVEQKIVHPYNLHLQ